MFLFFSDGAVRGIRNPKPGISACKEVADWTLQNAFLGDKSHPHGACSRCNKRLIPPLM
jgi:hypothetical protein